MGFRAHAAVCLLLVPLASAGVAQEHEEVSAPSIRPSGAAYLDATEYRGISRVVAYFDPTRPPPPLETRQALPAEDEDPLDVSLPGGRVLVLLVAGTVLAAVLYAVFAAGGRFSVSLSRMPVAEDRDGRAPGRPGVRDAPPPAALGAILSTADRKAALVQLCKALLARVMGEQGVLPDRSWTDRDTLRRVPRGHPQRDALQALVFASEKVRFGGRDVTEAEFRAHVDRLEPLWTRAGA